MKQPTIPKQPAKCKVPHCNNMVNNRLGRPNKSGMCSGCSNRITDKKKYYIGNSNIEFRVDIEKLRKTNELGHCLCNLQEKCPCFQFLTYKICKCGVYVPI